MSGLNYGYSYTKRVGMHKTKKVGVIYGDKLKKWIVRVYKNGTRQVITIARFETKEEADNYFLNLNQ